MDQHHELAMIEKRLDELRRDIEHYQFVYDDLKNRLNFDPEKTELRDIFLQGEKQKRHKNVKKRLIRLMESYRDNDPKPIDTLSKDSGIPSNTIRGVFHKQNKGEFESSVIPHTNGTKGWRLVKKDRVDHDALQDDIGHESDKIDDFSEVDSDDNEPF